MNSLKTLKDSIPTRITSDRKRRKLKKRDSCYVLPIIPMKRKPFASSQRRARSTQAQDLSSVRVASSRRRRKVFMGANQELGHPFLALIPKTSHKAEGPSAKLPKKEFAFGSLVRPPDKLFPFQKEELSPTISDHPWNRDPYLTLTGRATTCCARNSEHPRGRAPTWLHNHTDVYPMVSYPHGRINHHGGTPGVHRSWLYKGILVQGAVHSS